MSRRRALPFNRVRVSARLRSVLTAPPSLFSIDFSPPPQPLCPSTFWAARRAMAHWTRARLSTLQRDILNAVQALHTHPHIYTYQLCRPQSVVIGFSSTARRRSTYTSATRFQSQIPALGMVNFTFFFSLRGLGKSSFFLCCAAPVLRVSKPNALKPTNLGMRSARSNSVFLSEDAFTDLRARSSSLEYIVL
ncbi:hypothetical protein C8J57DRAFT_1302723 [Mycena rebaudengoi]|nr:hypothetical protein C8J57DRAFT_1302723 [Mycena rebaudengoi]